MKKIVLSLIAVFALSFGVMAENVDTYTLDESAVEQAFAQAEEVSISNVAMFNGDFIMPVQMENNAVLSANPNAWGAWAICWFLGEFGIHRHYLGTSKPMWLYYTLTCGGIFGVVTIVDWVVLLIGAIQNDISAYTNNDQFFMWL